MKPLENGRTKINFEESARFGGSAGGGGVGVASDTSVLDNHVCHRDLEGWQKSSGWASLDLRGLYQFCLEVSIIWVVGVDEVELGRLGEGRRGGP